MRYRNEEGFPHICQMGLCSTAPFWASRWADVGVGTWKQGHSTMAQWLSTNFARNRMPKKVPCEKAEIWICIQIKETLDQRFLGWIGLSNRSAIRCINPSSHLEIKNISTEWFRWIRWYSLGSTRQKQSSNWHRHKRKNNGWYYWDTQRKVSGTVWSRTSSEVRELFFLILWLWFPLDVLSQAFYT